MSELYDYIFKALKHSAADAFVAVLLDARVNKGLTWDVVMALPG